MMPREGECVPTRGGLPFWNRLLARGPVEREGLKHYLICLIGIQSLTSVYCPSGIPRRVNKGAINLVSGESK